MILPFPAIDILSFLGPVVFLYPEIHYVFKYFPFSLYRIREPEIIADAPYRIEPGQDIPVLLLVKDADKFPIILGSVVITLSEGMHSASVSFELNEKIGSAWWKKIFELHIPDEWRGQKVEIDVLINYEIGGKKKKIHNDNCPGLSHAPLKVNAAQYVQPGLENWVQGDLHFHTDFTDDQVEFGAPMDAAAVMAQAMGMQFFCATDHSYDLDDMENDFLHNDPDLKKWKRLHETIKQLNQKHGKTFVIIPGEEVSCGNAEHRNIHCLVLNHDTYLPGSGDGAERWLRTDSELTVNDVAVRVAPSALAIAAHPKDPIPFLEKILIRRGLWTDEDCRTHGVAGLQILNGLDNNAFREGLEQWRRQLLRGERVFIFAGNDAHGNFNRYRQVKVPMLSLHEIENHQPFGWARTCVWMGGKPLNVEHIVEQLRGGHAVITTGPLVVCTINNENGEIFQIGETAAGSKLTLGLQGETNAEIGKFTEIKIWGGHRNGKEFVLHNFKHDEMSFQIKLEMSLTLYSYIRCEAATSKKMFCYTNPIWIKAI